MNLDKLKLFLRINIQSIYVMNETLDALQVRVVTKEKVKKDTIIKYSKRCLDEINEPEPNIIKLKGLVNKLEKLMGKQIPKDVINFDTLN